MLFCKYKIQVPPSSIVQDFQMSQLYNAELLLPVNQILSFVEYSKFSIVNLDNPHSKMQCKRYLVDLKNINLKM